MAEIESVDAAELEEFEKLATARDAVPSVELERQRDRQRKAGSTPGAPRAAGPSTETSPGLERAEPPWLPDPSLTPIYTVGPDQKVKPYVEASALDARLVRLEHMVRHTMNLVIVLAEILRVDPAEVAHVDEQNRKAEAARKGTP